MTIGDFRVLQLTDQADAVCRNGTLIGDRRRGEYEVILYLLEDFYVEVFVHQKKRKVIAFTSFIDVHYLDPYLANIDISELLKMA